MAYEGRNEELLKRLFYARVEADPNSGCWLWFGKTDENGYGRISAPLKTRAHRMAYIWNVGPIPDGLVVMHKCDTPACVNHNHLKCGTQIDNIADRHSKGRSARTMGRSGEASAQAKLTAPQVTEIKMRLRLNESQSSIAKDYPVTRGMISRINVGLAWTDIN